MKIVNVRPGWDVKHVAKIDIEFAPGVRAVDISVTREPDGSMRVFSAGVRFDRAVADDIARAAVAAVGTKALSLLRLCLSSMGATPSDASRVSWAPAEEPDDLLD